jgi:hypothetical protein
VRDDGGNYGYWYSVCQKCGLVELKKKGPPRLGSVSISSARRRDVDEEQKILEGLSKNKSNQCRCNVSSQLIGSTRGPQLPAKRTQTSSLTNELVKLKDLFDQGVLTREQFERAKNKLLE